MFTMNPMIMRYVKGVECQQTAKASGELVNAMEHLATKELMETKTEREESEYWTYIRQLVGNT